MNAWELFQINYSLNFLKDIYTAVNTGVNHGMITVKGKVLMKELKKGNDYEVF